MAIDPQQLRTCLGYFATGVTIVSCTVGDAPHGATVNSFTAVSLDPPLVLVSLSRTSKAARLLAGRPFTVNVLSEEQRDLALRFAGSPEASGPSPSWLPAPLGLAPALSGSLANFSCSPWATYDGGDHVLFLGRVERLAHRPEARPLLFYRGSFHPALTRSRNRTDRIAQPG
ncbi:flavin reductase family protein [Streptomyces scopuliridis]|uniref:Flavin reductase family protein n=1 Tax=Streptomyces scopuliridis TaxID=452529 RepID=A0ACD4ZC57_9ACTN|nr:flavin reductase family protein [Streptomyces scopuliridis]WSB95847.1 flavin reductase family protein [Streptomyces scopuliridis]WSC10446.1 flavin reductase family protein [Streptomyces scopuliridis]